MFTINFESKFSRYFLGYTSRSELPKTICQLGRAIIYRAIHFLFFGALFGIMGAAYLTAAFGLLYVAFTDNTFREFFDLGEKSLTWYRASYMAFLGFNTGLAIIGIYVGIKAFKERKSRKLYERMEAFYNETGKWPDDEDLKAPSLPIIEFVKGIWARIHDKTCAMIQWENDPESVREAKRIAERKAWQVELDAQIKSAQNNA